MAKAKKKKAEKKYEIIQLDLTDEEVGVIARKAHEADMKLNDYLVKILVDYSEQVIKEHERKKAFMAAVPDATGYVDLSVKKKKAKK